MSANAHVWGCALKIPVYTGGPDWWNGKCATGNGLGLRLEWKANVVWNIDGGLQQRFGYDDPEPFSVRDFLTLSGGWQNPSDFFIVRSGKFFINNTFNSGRALAGSEKFAAVGILASSEMAMSVMLLLLRASSYIVICHDTCDHGKYICERR